MRLRRLLILVAAIAATVMPTVLVSTPASAATPIANPSVATTLSCGGAKAEIQIEWVSAIKVGFYWKLTDTKNDGKSPVLRIRAEAGNHDSTYFVFRNGNPHININDDAGRSIDGRTHAWNPDDIGNINHLWIKIQNGTNPQGVQCEVKRDVFNWSRIAFANAKDKAGAPYVWGAEGPNSFDCSGLVHYAINRMSNFPDLPRYSAQGLYDWSVRNAGDTARAYTKRVPFSDLKVGDLIFYNLQSNDGRWIDHVAFYAGNGKIFDAQRGAGVGLHNYINSGRVAAFRLQGKHTH